MSTAERPVAVVIEDDESIRYLVGAVLAKLGLRIVPAEHGEKGIADVREHRPALVTVDLRMPGIDGFATIRRIREFSDVPILMLSARDSESDEELGREAGADEYLRKPFRTRELRTLAAAMLRTPRRQDAGWAACIVD
ncbi:response regulator transcription factor [Gryllotalpicola ginsengisoli]|uniref:response regulator transcription factor n=1 Tax=Gryllotalpicola ginsengisoli TaxID=444608 RepID=UPI0012DF03F3|nr:response regulator [Gryllotalpicola ginsengisoli]